MLCLIESGAELALISAEMPNFSVCSRSTKVAVKVAGGNPHWYHSVAELPVIKPVVAVFEHYRRPCGGVLGSCAEP